LDVFFDGASGLSLDPPPSLEVDSVEPLLPPSRDDESPLDFARVPLVDDRSFLAQPEPLKWMAGLVSALWSVPSAPQFGQNLGPASSIRWITSIRCRQDAQT
jgi:hypothetical protein